MLRLTIDTSSAAFRDASDDTLDVSSLARYLETLASILRSGMVPPSIIIDQNGQRCGTLELTE